MNLSDLSSSYREELISKIDYQIWDVIIIGGGITGAGTALECMKFGWKTLLLEKGDFASGTSNKSSGMIHGGLRYLEQRNFNLVKEALKERFILGEIAPNLVCPNRFLFPIYKSFFNLLKIKIGLYLYDFFAGKYNLDKHQFISKSTIISSYPYIESRNLIGGFLYSDSLVSDAHLVFSNLNTAKKNGLELANYVSVENINKNKNIFAINWKDQLSQIIGNIKSKIVVSCAGVWTDTLYKNDVKFIRPTKGIHIVIPFQKLPIPTSFVLPAEDGRILFANKVGDFLYIGTTDTDFDSNFDNVYANRKDVDYILGKLNILFPNSKVAEFDIISTYAGLRPLINHAGNPSNLSREDFIKENDGFIMIVGGKLTTYRCMAKKVIDKIQNHLSDKRINEGLQKLNLVYFPEDDIEIQIENYLKYSMVINLTDMMDRRLNLYRFDMQNGIEYLDIVAKKMAIFLNWDEAEMKNQKQKYIDFIECHRSWEKAK